MSQTASDLVELERSEHSRLLSFDDLDGQIEDALPAERRASWREYRADWQRGAVDRPYPLQIDVALSRSCNLSCPMCTWSDPDAQQGGKREWMPLDTFTALLEGAVAKGLRGVGLNGVNEPLLRSDLPDFVRAAHQAGVLDIMLHTNGMLLTERMARGLIDGGLTRLMVSLDAVTRSTYDKIRVGGDLWTVERNIARFIAIRGERTLPVLGVCFVEMAANAHELPAFIDRWRSIADFFSIQSYLDPWGTKGRLARADRAPSEAGFVCPQPFQRMRVGHDGAVHPCCSFYGDQITVGHARDGIEAVWQGLPIREMRQLHAAGGWAEHPVCRACVTSSYTEARA